MVIGRRHSSLMKKFRRASVSSRLKALLSVTENFTRADNAGLGAANNTSALWNSVRGSWGIATNKGSSSAASGYPLSTLTFSKEDVTLSASGTGPGVGTAFWVTDSNNWWATYVQANQVCQTCTNTVNCATFVTNFTFTPASGGNCANFTTTCNSYNAYNPGNTFFYQSCDNFWTQNSCPGSFGGGCGACAENTCYNNPSGHSCGYINCSYVGGYNFPVRCCCNTEQGSNASGGNCASSSTNCAAYNTYYPSTFNSTTNCATYNTATNYDCDCVTNQSVSLIKSVSGTITNVANHAFNAAVASFKTILSGDVVTVQGFSSTGYTSQIGANRTTNISGQATKTKKHGIIAAPVTHAAAQTTVISEFKVE
jgi:hypothetical protein